MCGCLCRGRRYWAVSADLPREDDWEQANSHLAVYLREHPEIERELLDGPLDALAPADQMYRALALDERGQHAEARAATEAALRGIYTPEYLACGEALMQALLEALPPGAGPIVDLASGAGRLSSGWRRSRPARSSPPISVRACSIRRGAGSRSSAWARL